MRTAAAGRVGGVRAHPPHEGVSSSSKPPIGCHLTLPSEWSLYLGAEVTGARPETASRGERLTAALKTIHGGWHALLLTAAKKVLDGHVTHDV